MTIYCDCTLVPPWPELQRLHVAGASRWYLCRACGAVVEHVCRPDGTIVETRRLEAGDGVPDVVEAAVGEREPEYKQLGLFG
jgi:hypothetical protein